MNPKAILATVASVVAASMAQADDVKKDVQTLNSVSLSLTDAIRKAEKEGMGKALEAELESDRSDHPEYEVEVLSGDGKTLTEYRLDANAGGIVSARKEPFEKIFTRIKPEDIERSPTSLTGAVGTAEGETGGKVIEAETERSGDSVRYEIKVGMADGSSRNVTIDGMTGKLASK